MEIITKSQIKKFVVIISIVLIFFTSAPLFFYISVFGKNGISAKSDAWSNFGSYFGGVVGTLLNSLAIIFSLIGIYISLKIASKIQEEQIKFNQENQERAEALVYKQNKPFPYFALSNYGNQIIVAIQNFGAGPLIIKKIWIEHEHDSYDNFRKFIISQKLNTQNLDIFLNTAPTHILIPGGSKDLLNIKIANNDFLRLAEYKNLLKSATVKIEYEDIFENQDSYEKDLSFLGN